MFDITVVAKVSGLGSDLANAGMDVKKISSVKYHINCDNCQEVTPQDETTPSVENTSNQPQAKASETLQIPRSSSSSVSPSLNTTTASQQQTSYLSYQNPTHGFTIQYPSNWSVKEQPEAGRVVSFDDINKGVQFYVKHDKLPSQYSTLTEYVNALLIKSEWIEEILV